MKFPIVFAHRGANSFAPENSLAAFQKALDLGCDGIELDLRYTADGQVVVFHDRNTFRLTGERYSIHRSSYDKIKNLRLLSQHYPFERIPLLQEVLELIGKNALINIDVKKESLTRNGFEEKILTILRDMGLEENIIISSFNPFVLKKMYAHNPRLHYGFIFRNRSSMMMLNGHPVSSLHARYAILSSKYLYALKHRAEKIYAWTVDDEFKMFDLIRRGIDGVITNKPEIFLNLKKAKTKTRINRAEEEFVDL
ncbi:MAG: glycerophosphodiester phosphodiesterase [Calditrichia bacterium]